jgi:hypothetical protein
MATLAMAAPTMAPAARYALVVHGLVGSLSWSPSAALWRNDPGSTKLIKFCSASHLAYIVRSNRRHGVDVFVHSWNPELADYIDQTYGQWLRGSLHQPPEFVDKARSQAISLSRAVQLLLQHERVLKRRYTVALVLRFDGFVSAPIDLDGFGGEYIWFSEICCTRHAETPLEKALVLGTCGASNATYRKGKQFTRRLLGSCTPDIMRRGRQESAVQPNNAYMLQ